jgi:hypothetical protein
MVDEEPPQVCSICGEHDGRFGLNRVGGDDGIDATGYPSGAGTLHAETKVTRSPSCGLRCLNGAEPPYHLAGRGVRGTTGDRL